MKTKLLMAIGLMLLVSCGGEPSKPKKKLTLTADQEKILSDIESDGYIVIKPYDREVWVEPFFWQTCKYDAKYNLGYLVAVKSAQAQGSDLYFCTIYDNRTGKKLAKWSESWGFDVE
jgi:hypothetical protein